MRVNILIKKVFDFSFKENMLANGEKIFWEIKKVIPVNEKPINSYTVVFRAYSPVIVEDVEEKSILFLEKRFEKELNEVTDRILKSETIKGKGLEKPLKFEPLN